MASSPEYIARGRGGGGGAAGVACEAGGAFAFGVRLARAADVEEKRGKETRKKKSAGGEKKKGKKKRGREWWVVNWVGPGRGRHVLSDCLPHVSDSCSLL